MRCGASVARRRVNSSSTLATVSFVRACASSPSTSTASAPPSARASRAGSRAASRGTSSACRRSRRTHDDVPRACARRGESHAHFHAGAAQGLRGRRAVYASARHRSSAASAAREFDCEGRYLEADFGELTVISLYLPSGSSGSASAGVEVPLPRRVPAASRQRCASASARRSSCAATGTSRTSRSTSRTGAATRRTRASCPRSARGSRACSTSSASSTCSARSMRVPTQYTWWSNRGQAWAKNVGWRIDYQIATPGIAAKAHAACDLQEPALLRPRAARSSTTTTRCNVCRCLYSIPRHSIAGGSHCFFIASCPSNTVLQCDPAARSGRTASVQPLHALV